MKYASLLHMKMMQLCILFTLRPKVWAAEDDTNISVMGGTAACAGGQLGGCRSGGDRRAELAQVPLRALPCVPLSSSIAVPCGEFPSGCPPRQGPSTRVYSQAVPQCMGEDPPAQLPKTSFPCSLVWMALWQSWPWAQAAKPSRAGGQARLQSPLVQSGPWHPLLFKFYFHFLLSSEAFLVMLHSQTCSI